MVSNTTNQYFDIVIIGSGPAAIATAITLIESGQSVCLITRKNKRLRVGESLLPDILEPLYKLGVWDEFLKIPHVKSPGIISFWGSEQATEIDFMFNPYGAGWHVDRHLFDSMLINFIKKLGVTIYETLENISLTQTTQGDWKIEMFQHNVSIDTKFLVDATGKTSFLARKLGVKRIYLDNLVGIFGYYKLASAKDLDLRLFIEASSNGWWYSLPLPHNWVSTVYLTDLDQVPKGVNAVGKFWYKKLDKVKFLNSKSLIGDDLQLSTVLANTSYLKNFYGNNWLAVGDAAITIDPLSGQGTYRALISGINAGQAISSYIAKNTNQLSEYSDWLKEVLIKNLENRTIYYTQEQRWIKKSFWKERHTVIKYDHILLP